MTMTTFRHPIEHDNVDTTGMPDHDNTVDQFDCEGCHARMVEMLREACGPVNIEVKGRWETVTLDPDPAWYPVRWLSQWDGRHP